ncbi:MAG: nucleotide-binding protein [candidate division WOR-3 bacterium]
MRHLTHQKFKKRNLQKQITYFISLLTTIFCLTSELLSQTRVYTASEAVNHIGEYATVKGYIAQVYISRKGTIFLNVDKPYPDNTFTFVIFKTDAYKFPNIKSLEGKTIAVTGLIRTYQGKPEIIINNPKQIKILK